MNAVTTNKDALKPSITAHWAKNGLNSLDVVPASVGGAGEDRVADFLRFQSIAEIGVHRLAGFEALQEIGDLMNEGVLVADLQTRAPTTCPCRA